MDVFISYETTTGLSYASHLKKALSKTIKMSAFVADEDIPKGEQGTNVMDEALRNCKYFVAIMTMGAILSPDEVNSEVVRARRLDKDMIPCRLRTIDRFFVTSRFPLISGLQQIYFDSKEDLAEQVITTIVKREQKKVAGRTGTEEARETEFTTIQTSIHAMMVDNEISSIPNPAFAFAGGAGTNDMTGFPDATSVGGSADKPTDPSGTAYTAVDDPGYVLANHDRTGGGTSGPPVNYVTMKQTKYYYTCEADGTVRQFSDSALTTEYTY